MKEQKMIEETKNNTSLKGTEWLEKLQLQADRENNGVLVFANKQEMWDFFEEVDEVKLVGEVAHSPGVYFVNLYNEESDEHLTDFENGKIDWTFQIAFEDEY